MSSFEESERAQAGPQAVHESYREGRRVMHRDVGMMRILLAEAGIDLELALDYFTLRNNFDVVTALVYKFCDQFDLYIARQRKVSQAWTAVYKIRSLVRGDIRNSHIKGGAQWIVRDRLI